MIFDIFRPKSIKNIKKSIKKTANKHIKPCDKVLKSSFGGPQRVRAPFGSELARLHNDCQQTHIEIEIEIESKSKLNRNRN